MRSLLLIALAACSLLPGCRKEVAPEEEVAEVRLAPDFTLTSIDGEEFTLSEKRGNLVVMDFWATWCKPCVAAMPHMQQLHEDYKDRHVIVTGVNLWEFDEKADPAAFVREHNYTYTQLLNGEEVGTAYGLTNQIPVFFIIGFEGEIIDQRAGFSVEELPEIRKTLDDYLAEHAAIETETDASAPQAPPP